MEWIVLSLAGITAGLLAGLTGLAGGVVVVPVITSIYGPEALQQAIVVSWCCVFANSLSAASRQWRDRNPQQRRELLRLTRWYLLGAAPVSAAVALFATGRQGLVTAPLVGALQLALVIAILLPPPATKRRRWKEPTVDLGLGALVGGLSTVTGTGGACYTIAYLVSAVGAHLRDAVAAASVAGAVIGGLAVVGYLVSRQLWPGNATELAQWPIGAAGVLVVVTAGTLAAPLGVAWGRRLPAAVLRHAIAGALSLSALRLLFA